MKFSISPRYRAAGFILPFVVAACAKVDKYMAPNPERMDGRPDVHDGPADLTMPGVGGASGMVDAPAVGGADGTVDGAPPADVEGSGAGDAATPADLGAATQLDSAPSLLGGGTGCSTDSQCSSGQCLDGICCATACSGKCQSCASAQTGLGDGACGPVRAGNDPRNECEKSAEATCGDDGTCDGAGGCRKYGTASVCAPESCANGGYTSPRFCDGKGSCSPGTSASCGAFPCDGARCRMDCTRNEDCVTGNYCEAARCVAKKTPGSACANGAQCMTGYCVDKVCCNSACADRCHKCTSGQCVPQTQGEDLREECGGACRTGTCDGKGGCGASPSMQPGPGCSGNCQRCGGSGACETIPELRCWRDRDSDSFGDPKELLQSCSERCADGYVANDRDCLDSNANVHPATSSSPVGFYERHRGDGTFDYDCSGSITVDPPTWSVCERTAEGGCSRFDRPIPPENCGGYTREIQPGLCGCRPTGATCGSAVCPGLDLPITCR
jgi:hypothetical protein